MKNQLIVTHEQFVKGWVEFRPHEVPNIIEHRYELIKKRPDGTCLVVAPEVKS